jgi:transposase InsO family protein
MMSYAFYKVLARIPFQTCAIANFLSYWLKNGKDEDAHRSVADFVRRYNTERLHSAIGYITPQDKLERRAEAIQAERQRKLIAAGEARKQQRKAS